MRKSAIPARNAAARRGAQPRRRGIRGARRFAAPAVAVLLAVASILDGTASGGAPSDTTLTPQAGDPAAAAASAVYSVTFTGIWTDDATRGGVPDGAHFSPLIGAVHNAAVTFLEAGGTASPGVEAMAERGRTAALTDEIKAAGANALSVLRKESGAGATGSATFESVTLTADHPRITLLSMIAPSPDWFVGVSGLSLLDAEGRWIESLSVDLFPWDAGTEEGTEFSFFNAATTPPEAISLLRGTGKFLDAPIAAYSFTLQSVE